jgi:hypothetical protein
VLVNVPGGDFLLSGQVLEYLRPSILRFLRLNTYVSIAIAFGPLWLPAIYAWGRCSLPVFLRHCLWFIPLAIMAIIVGTGNTSRSLFLIFPVVIPLAVLGLSRWLSDFDQLRPATQ